MTRQTPIACPPTAVAEVAPWTADWQRGQGHGVEKCKAFNFRLRLLNYGFFCPNKQPVTSGQRLDGPRIAGGSLWDRGPDTWEVCIGEGRCGMT